MGFVVVGIKDAPFDLGYCFQFRQCAEGCQGEGKKEGRLE
jgi:hypothetical protein